MAGRVALDFKQFKHVSSDGKTTKLKHQDGHFLVLSHKSLSHEAQKQLGALSKVTAENVSHSEHSQSNANNERQMSNGGKVVDKSQSNENAMLPESEARDKAVQYGKGEAPTRSASQVLQDAAANWWDAPQKKAEGGDVEERVHAPDNYGKPEAIRDISSVPDEAIADQPALDENEQLIDKSAAVPLQAAAQSQVSNDRVEVQKLYNSIVSGNPNNSASQINTRPWAVFGPNGEPPKAFDANSWTQAEQMAEKLKSDATGVSQEKQGQIQADNEVRMRAGLPPMEVPAGAIQPPQPKGNIEPQASSMAQSMPEQQDSMQAGMGNQADLMQQGYQNEMAGVQGMAKAEGGLGQEQAKAYNTNIEAGNNAQLLFNERYKALEAERQAHMADIKNAHIDPDKYWNNHSKIAAGIGMILAGFNPSGTPNAAIQYLQHQMDQNIEAQKQNLNSQQNLLAANLRQFGNAKDAVDMTRLMQADIMQNALGKAAAEAKNPMAQQAALIAQGKLQKEYAPLQMQMAMRQAMTKIAQNPSGDPARDVATANHMVSYFRASGMLDQAKEMESRIVPGVGVATIPVPEATRTQLVAHQQLDNAAKDLYKWASTHSTIVPGTAEYNVGAQKAQALQQMYRHGQLHTVYREGEQPLLDKVVNGNPAGFLKYFSSLPKLKEVIEQNDRQANILKQSSGLRPAQQQEQAEPVVRMVKGRAALFDPVSKKFLGYK